VTIELRINWEGIDSYRVNAVVPAVRVTVCSAAGADIGAGPLKGMYRLEAADHQAAKLSFNLELRGGCRLGGSRPLERWVRGRYRAFASLEVFFPEIPLRFRS
jgi:hypothetical protein